MPGLFLLAYLFAEPKNGSSARPLDRQSAIALLVVCLFGLVSIGIAIATTSH